MKIYLTILLAFLTFSLSFAQRNPKNLNGYRFAYVQKLEYKNGGIDNYGLASSTKSFLQRKGFYILGDDRALWPKEATYNPCEIINVLVNNKGGAKVFLEIRNCKGEVVYNDDAHAANWVNDFADNYRRSLNNIFNRFGNYSLSFDSSKTPKIDYPEVEKTNDTEISLKEYFSSNKLNILEGIYKSYQAPTLPFYKIGIKRIGDKYVAIILEAEEHSPWKPGEIKAYFEPSSMKGLYSVKWYMGNKTPYETFAHMENGTILSMEFTNPTNGEKRTDKFIKMYPPSDGEITYKDVQKSSGSGFFLTTSGIIATNAHVVENAETLKVQILNEIGNFEYSAKVLLVDNQNDVALIKIEDEEFEELSSIPYSLVEKADIGENAFTIGFPLNDVMGTNYKVTDGIVSAVSGIGDDMRYYQISVPLQPGNSGGPLFNNDGDIIGITSARLNSKAVGTYIENVNYAIKISYLLNLYNMLPNADKLSTTPTQSDKELQEQVKILKSYVCLIKVN